MARVTIESVRSEIGQRIAKKFGLKHTDLHRLLSKTRGRLPRGFEKDLSYLLAAEIRTQHPKRRGQVDLNRLKMVRRVCLAKLDGVDLARDKTRARSLRLAEFAARMLLYVAAMVSLLYLLGMLPDF